LRSIGISEIIIILVVVLAIFLFARLRRQPRPQKKTDQTSVVTGEETSSGSPRNWITTGLVLLALGLLAYYFFFVYPQP